MAIAQHQACVSSTPSVGAYQREASSSRSVPSSSVVIVSYNKSLCGLRAVRSSTGLPRVPRGKGARVVCAVGDVSAEGTNYLIAGAIAVTLIGSAYPLLFSRKDLCPECDGAGFIRKTGSALSANAARKDQAQIVCPNCKGLGKIGQVDK